MKSQQNIIELVTRPDHRQVLTVRHHRDQKKQTQVVGRIRPALCIPPTPMKMNSEHPRGSVISKAPDQANSRPIRLPSHPIKCPPSPGSSFTRKWWNRMGVGARKAKPKAKGVWAPSSNPLPSWTITQVGVPQKLPGFPSLPNPPCQTLSLWGSPVSSNTSETDQVTGPDLRIVIVNKKWIRKWLTVLWAFLWSQRWNVFEAKSQTFSANFGLQRGNVNLIHTRYSLPSYRVHILIIKL